MSRRWSRHHCSPGSTGSEAGLANGPWVARTAADLLIFKTTPGISSEGPCPLMSTCRHVVAKQLLGDLNRDGLRDLALGGQGSEADFWMNETEVPESTRLLMVEFASTVSAHPPVGAHLEASCGGVVRTRVMTSGGKMGGSPQTERGFAWPGCNEEPTVTVHWPSGATSIHSSGPGEIFLLAQEPVWVQEGSLGDTTVLLDPTEPAPNEPVSIRSTARRSAVPWGGAV